MQLKINTGAAEIYFFFMYDSCKDAAVFEQDEKTSNHAMILLHDDGEKKKATE